MTQFYKLGCVSALRFVGLRLTKLSGEAVMVTDHQTYQHKPDPIFTSDPQARGAGIDTTWDNHDRRFQTTIQAPADITSQMTGADG